MNNVDISNLLNNKKEYLEIEYKDIDFKKLLEQSPIIRLENVKTKLKITKLVDDSVDISGYIEGIMVLPDDLTLEEVEIRFKEKISENLTNVTNTLDIFSILWQNILVNIPAKITSNSDRKFLKGDGWRVISEEEYAKEKASDNPFAKLNELFKDGKER